MERAKNRVAQVRQSRKNFKEAAKAAAEKAAAIKETAAAIAPKVDRVDLKAVADDLNKRAAPVKEEVKEALSAFSDLKPLFSMADSIALSIEGCRLALERIATSAERGFVALERIEYYAGEASKLPTRETNEKTESQESQ